MLKHVNSKIAILASRLFLIFQISFWFKTHQWLEDIQGNFFNMNFAGKKYVYMRVFVCVCVFVCLCVFVCVCVCKKEVAV